MEEKHDSSETFDVAVQTWKKAQVVREGPTKIFWPAAEMIQVLAADIGEYRQQLVKCLFDDEQLVVAHALLVLTNQSIICPTQTIDVLMCDS